MNTYTSEAMESFTLVRASGLIAVAALAVASLIGFTVAFLVCRERAVVAVPAGSRAAVPAVEVRPPIALPSTPAYATETWAAVAG